MGMFISWVLNCDHRSGCNAEHEGEGDDSEAREWVEANGWYMGPAPMCGPVMCAKHNSDNKEG